MNVKWTIKCWLLFSGFFPGICSLYLFLLPKATSAIAHNQPVVLAHYNEFIESTKIVRIVFAILLKGIYHDTNRR